MAISVRKSIRWPPALPAEPTSTLVLTSPRHGFFVDVRVLDPAVPPSLAGPPPSAPYAPPTPTSPLASPALRRDAKEFLEWAFAGTAASMGGSPGSTTTAPTGAASSRPASVTGTPVSSSAATGPGASATTVATSATASSGSLPDGTSPAPRPDSPTACKKAPHSRRNSEKSASERALQLQPLLQQNRRQVRRRRWTHWLDSQTESPEAVVDEADMEETSALEALERGRMRNRETGREQDYEEVWRELAVPGRKVCLVLRAENEALRTRGMAIRVGGWCQGVLKIGSETSAERWRWLRAEDGSGGGGGGSGGGNGGVVANSAAVNGSKRSGRERRASGTGAAAVAPVAGRWECVLRIGQGPSLPCQVLWEKEDALAEGEEVRSGGLAWQCVERAVW